MPSVSTLQRLRDRGFDRSSVYPFESRWHVACSRCQALVINGIACHERGCPNQVHKNDGTWADDDD